MNKLCKYSARKFPGASFHLQPADIVTQVLNFGQFSPPGRKLPAKNLLEQRLEAERQGHTATG